MGFCHVVLEIIFFLIDFTRQLTLFVIIVKICLVIADGKLKNNTRL